MQSNQEYEIQPIIIPTEQPSNDDIFLTEEETKEILKSDSFGAFIDISSKMIERALNDTYDYTIDYRKEPDSKGNDSKSNVLLCTFYNERWCSGRSVTR